MKNIKDLKKLLVDSFDRGYDSFSTRLLDSRQQLIEDNKQAITDAYSNALTGTGKADITKKFEGWDLSNNALNWPLWLALYNDSWLFRRAIDKPAQDIINLEVSYNNVEDVDKLGEVKKNLKRLKSKLIELLMWGGLYGGSVGVMLFEGIGLEEMKKPLRIKDLTPKTKLQLFVVDRWSGLSTDSTNLVLDPQSDEFLQPKFYNVYIGKQSYKIHHSYCLRYEHRPAPKLIKSSQLMGWGFPEGVHIVNELMRDEKIKNSITSLIDKSLIEVIKMAGMRSVFMGTEEAGEEQLRKRLEMVNWGRNYNSLTFLDTEDDYQQNTFGGLGGLADLMDKNMETLAAALDMTGILYGDMSGGFSPDNYALVRYDTMIRNRADAFYRPVLNKLLKVLYGIYEIDVKDIEFDFESMIQVKEDKLDKAQKIIGLLSSMINDGYMTPKMAGEEMMKIAKDVGVGETITEDTLTKIDEMDENDVDEPEDDELEKL